MESSEQENGPETGRHRHLAEALAARPFRPHRLFRNGHAQTLAAYAWPGRALASELGAGESRLFEVEPGAHVLVHCHWQKEQRQQRPTVLLVHGLEGSSASVYMVSTGRLFFRAGFNVLRLNMRNCGGTEHLTPTLYHSGMSSDLDRVLRELLARDQLSRLFLIGFSMGGNLVLKLAGEYGREAPAELLGFCAISPALDLSASAAAIELPSNWYYQKRFLDSLRRRMHTKERLYPGVYDASHFRRVRSVRDFDEIYTARHGGFTGADDYYERSSAIKVIDRIRRPTLIIHAQDDPFIPAAPLRQRALERNPDLLLLVPPHGGHVGFVSGSRAERFWAEARALQFCRLLLAEEEETA